MGSGDLQAVSSNSYVVCSVVTCSPTQFRPSPRCLLLTFWIVTLSVPFPPHQAVLPSLPPYLSNLCMMYSRASLFLFASSILPFTVFPFSFKSMY